MNTPVHCWSHQQWSQKYLWRHLLAVSTIYYNPPILNVQSRELRMNRLAWPGKHLKACFIGEYKAALSEYLRLEVWIVSTYSESYIVSSKKSSVQSSLLHWRVSTSFHESRLVWCLLLWDQMDWDLINSCWRVSCLCLGSLMNARVFYNIWRDNTFHSFRFSTIFCLSQA